MQGSAECGGVYRVKRIPVWCTLNRLPRLATHTGHMGHYYMVAYNLLLLLVVPQCVVPAPEAQNSSNQYDWEALVGLDFGASGSYRSVDHDRIDSDHTGLGLEFGNTYCAICSTTQSSH